MMNLFPCCRWRRRPLFMSVMSRLTVQRRILRKITSRFRRVVWLFLVLGSGPNSVTRLGRLVLLGKLRVRGALLSRTLIFLIRFQSNVLLLPKLVLILSWVVLVPTFRLRTLKLLRFRPLTLPNVSFPFRTGPTRRSVSTAVVLFVVMTVLIVPFFVSLTSRLMGLRVFTFG